jgi:hypothetical protein
MDKDKLWIRRMYKANSDFMDREKKISTSGDKCSRCGCSNRQELYLFGSVVACGLCACYMGKMEIGKNGKPYRV